MGKLLLSSAAISRQDGKKFVQQYPSVVFLGQVFIIIIYTGKTLLLMSEEIEAVGTRCASCGITEIDDIKLMPCDDCDLVKYCCDDCQQEHKSEHKEACKKRAAELRDELLFKQPESSHLGDCPICMIPLSLDMEKSITYECCSKVVCMGCICSIMRDADASMCLSCPFCRNSARTKEESEKLRMKRVMANDPAAIREEGVKQYNKGNYRSAFEYLAKAAGLGDAIAHYKLSIMYQLEEGAEKDEEKVKYHLEEAAIAGHPEARFDLGRIEWGNANYERAKNHMIIGATQGHDASIKILMHTFKGGEVFKIKKKLVSKEDLEAAFRAHKAAVDATKSPGRELEEKLMSKFTG